MTRVLLKENVLAPIYDPAAAMAAPAASRPIWIAPQNQTNTPEVVAYRQRFALWWVAMVHDYALWRDDQAFVTRLLPGVRAVLDGFLGMLNAGGLHPRGQMDVQLQVGDGGLSRAISLPAGVSGTLRYGGVTRELVAGVQQLRPS